jgi:nicotinamide mononucleotide adenylyltransferase
MKVALFIGRWQPLHKGHEWLFEQKLSKGIPIMIMIRDVQPDENNPLTVNQVYTLIKKRYANTPNVSVCVFFDIESVNYGRGVGYEVNEFVPPSDVANISATQIRTAIAAGDQSWKNSVDPSIQEDLAKLLVPTP